jgi:hypothetical protein
MEVLFGFVIAAIQLLTVVLVAGRPALGLNPKFWPRLVLGLLPSFIVVAVILCRRKKKKVKQRLLQPVSSEEIFDPVLQLEEPGRIKRSDIRFLARA